MVTQRERWGILGLSSTAFSAFLGIAIATWVATMNHIGASILFVCSAMCFIGTIWFGYQLWKHRRDREIEPPLIEVNAQKEKMGEEMYLAVRNVGGVAKFEAKIEILTKNCASYGLKDRYFGYWEKSQGHFTSIMKGSDDRLKIAGVNISTSAGISAISNLLYYYDLQSQQLRHVESDSYIVGADPPIVKPRLTFRVTICAEPEFANGPFIRDYELELSRFEEIRLIE